MNIGYPLLGEMNSPSLVLPLFFRKNASKNDKKMELHNLKAKNNNNEPPLYCASAEERGTKGVSSIHDQTKQATRQLRQNMTTSEKMVWDIVRNRNLNGKKFLRQYAIEVEEYGNKKLYVADFYCAEKKLIIEIDGEVHSKQREYDEVRTEKIEKLGFTVVRIKNEELKSREVATELLKKLIM